MTAPYVKPTIGAVEAGRRAGASPQWALLLAFPNVPIDPAVEAVDAKGERVNPKRVSTAQFELWFSENFPGRTLIPAHVQK
jgi:hypothetical protein